jgi:hypothetical protein
VLTPWLLCCSDTENQELDEQQLGYLLLQLSKLETIVGTMPKHDRRLLLEDLAQLRSLDYTVRQKNLFVQQMFRTYPWLGHRAGPAFDL